jgi:signal peptidase I
MVKRLIGLPGDKIHIRDGFVTVNGQPLGDRDAETGFASSAQDEWVYAEHVGHHIALVRRTRTLFRPENLDLVVPDGNYFAMGDNRDNSYDSRGWGVIPRANIQGQAVGVLYNLAWTPLPSVDWHRIGHKFD